MNLKCEIQDDFSSIAEGNYYVLVGLTNKEQEEIMKGLNQTHSTIQPFPTWLAVGDMLSNSLFSKRKTLHLLTTMGIRQREYILFTTIKSDEGDASKPNHSENDTQEQSDILQVVIEAKVGNEWTGYYKKADPQVCKYVTRGTIIGLLPVHAIAKSI